MTLALPRDCPTFTNLWQTVDTNVNAINLVLKNNVFSAWSGEFFTNQICDMINKG